MLQRLEQETAALVFDPGAGRFCFVLHGLLVDLVRPSTVEVLTRAGLIQRERSATPCYSISDRGRSAIRQKIDKECLVDSNDAAAILLTNGLDSP